MEEAATSEETDPWEISISYVAKAGNRGPIGRLPSGRLVDWVQRSDYPREQPALQAFGGVTKPLGTQSPEETLLGYVEVSYSSQTKLHTMRALPPWSFHRPRPDLPHVCLHAWD